MDDLLETRVFSPFIRFCEKGIRKTQKINVARVELHRCKICSGSLVRYILKSLQNSRFSIKFCFYEPRPAYYAAKTARFIPSCSRSFHFFFSVCYSFPSAFCLLYISCALPAFPSGFPLFARFFMCNAGPRGHGSVVPVGVASEGINRFCFELKISFSWELISRNWRAVSSLTLISYHTYRTSGIIKVFVSAAAGQQFPPVRGLAHPRITIQTGSQFLSEISFNNRGLTGHLHRAPSSIISCLLICRLYKPHNFVTLSRASTPVFT